MPPNCYRQICSQGNAAIAGIGQIYAVDDAGVISGTTPHVQLGVPALLGTLTTPDGLGAANFEATSVGLLNAAGDGFLSNPPTPTYEVNLIPEPASLVLLGLGGVMMMATRRQKTV